MHSCAKVWGQQGFSLLILVLIETGELRYTFNSAVSWAAVLLCFLDKIWVSTWTCLQDSFLILTVLIPFLNSLIPF